MKVLNCLSCSGNPCANPTPHRHRQGVHNSRLAPPSRSPIPGDFTRLPFWTGGQLGTAVVYMGAACGVHRSEANTHPLLESEPCSASEAQALSFLTRAVWLKKLRCQPPCCGLEPLELLHSRFYQELCVDQFFAVPEISSEDHPIICPHLLRPKRGSEVAILSNLASLQQQPEVSRGVRSSRTRSSAWTSYI